MSARSKNPILRVTPFLAIPLLFGCEKDARILRQTSMLNQKTQLAAREFDASKTPDDKIRVAKGYFDTAPKMTQVLDDYMSGKKPADPPTAAPTPAPAPATTTPVPVTP